MGTMSKMDEPDICPICWLPLTWKHDHKSDNSGLDDGPEIRKDRKKYAAPSPEAARDARARAWATRREQYGPRGHR